MCLFVNKGENNVSKSWGWNISKQIQLGMWYVAKIKENQGN